MSLAHAHVTGPLAPAARPARGEARPLVSVLCICALMSLGLSRAHIPSRSASRVLAPVTVTVAAWTEEEAWVRAALASWCSWRETVEVEQMVLEVCWAEPGQVGTKPTYTRSPKGTKMDAELCSLPGPPDLSVLLFQY